MTKANEIEILREAARKLGADSYCGPLLLSLLPQIEADMSSDFMPEVNLRKVQDECTAARTACAKECEEKKARAAADACKIVDDARAERDQIKHRLACELNGALKRLGC